MEEYFEKLARLMHEFFFARKLQIKIYIFTNENYIQRMKISRNEKMYKHFKYKLKTCKIFSAIQIKKNFTLEI